MSSEGYDDLVERLKRIATPEQLLKGMTPEERLVGMTPEEFLAGMKPEERLAGMKPEERRAGLSPDETVLVLDDEVLRRLPETLIDAPEPVRSEVRRRIGEDHS